MHHGSMQLGGNLPESLSQYKMLGHGEEDEVDDVEDTKVGSS
jgi:hypothetical protein